MELTFFVLDDLSDDGFKIVEANEFKAACKPQHGYAITIHKFQGSEADTIVYGISANKYESVQHMYTAVTRGKKKVIIVSNPSDLESALARQPLKRQTSLEQRVRKALQEKNWTPPPPNRKRPQLAAAENLARNDQSSSKRRRRDTDPFADADSSIENFMSQIASPELSGLNPIQNRNQMNDN